MSEHAKVAETHTSQKKDNGVPTPSKSFIAISAIFLILTAILVFGILYRNRPREYRLVEMKYDQTMKIDVRAGHSPYRVILTPNFDYWSEEEVYTIDSRGIKRRIKGNIVTEGPTLVNRNSSLSYLVLVNEKDHAITFQITKRKAKN